MTEPPPAHSAVRALLNVVEPLELTPAEIAEALWLASFLPPPQQPADQAGPGQPAPETRSPLAPDTASAPGPADEEGRLADRAAGADQGGLAGAVAVTIPEPGRVSGPVVRMPGVPALPRTLELSRALRPLKRTWRPLHSYLLDEEATAVLSAETKFVLPVVRPAPARWLDLALVVDNGPSMALWRDLAAEFRSLLEMQGAFRDIRLWQLAGTGDVGYELRAGQGRPAVSPQQLVDTTGRRLVILLTDCVADGWRDGSMARMLGLWAHLCRWRWRTPCRPALEAHRG